MRLSILLSSVVVSSLIGCGGADFGSELSKENSEAVELQPTGGAMYAKNELEIAKLCDITGSEAKRRRAGKKMVNDVKALALKFEKMNGHLGSTVVGMSIPSENLSVDSDTGWIVTNVRRSDGTKLDYRIEVLFLICAHEKPDVLSSESKFWLDNEEVQAPAQPGLQVSEVCASEIQRVLADYTGISTPFPLTARSAKDGQMLITGTRFEPLFDGRSELVENNYRISVEEVGTRCLVHGVR